MPYRPVPTPQPCPEADLDTPQMTEAAACVEGGEEQVAMLAELARYGMELAKAQRDHASARYAAVAAAQVALNPGEDPAAPFDRTSLTVRRTIALWAKLSADVEKRRAGLEAERKAARAKRAADHAAAVKEVIDIALGDAFDADLVLPDFDPEADPHKPEPYEIERAEMLDEAEDLLGGLDESGDWLERSVGETVAKLCAALGLAPDACVKQGGVWMVRRPPSTYEILRDARKGSILPPLLGRDRTRSVQGGEPSMTSTNAAERAFASDSIAAASVPHPDRFAICPSPFRGREGDRIPLTTGYCRASSTGWRDFFP